MDVRAAAERFAATWQEHWVSGTPEPIAALYAEDCVHRSMPFRAPHEGRDDLLEYIRWSFAEEHATSASFSRPLVDGNDAVMQFWVAFREGSTLAGCVFARFNEAGLVTESRDYWNASEHPEQDPGFF